MKIKKIIILYSLFIINIFASIDFQPFQGYVPKGDVLSILADLNIADNDIITSKFSPIKSYEKYTKVEEAISLSKFIKMGFFEKEKKPCFYIYSKKSKNSINKGIIGKIAIDNYINNEIKQHEKIIPNKAEFAKKIILAQNAFIEPILLAYKENKKINNLIKKKTKEYPYFVINTKNKTEYCIWKISSKKEIDLITKAINSLPSLYIADGHHRSAAAALIKNNKIKYITAALFSDKEISIYPYHRMIKSINNLTNTEFKKIIKNNFILKKTDKRYLSKKNIRLYMNAQWYTIKNKKSNQNNFIKKLMQKINSDKNEIIKNLAPLILHKKILLNIFKNEKTLNENIEYVSGNLTIDQIISNYEKGNHKALFLLPAICPQDFLNIVECKANLPPKTTWIEPKIKAGIIVKYLED